MCPGGKGKEDQRDGHAAIGGNFGETADEVKGPGVKVRQSRTDEERGEKRREEGNHGGERDLGGIPRHTARIFTPSVIAAFAEKE